MIFLNRRKENEKMNFSTLSHWDRYILLTSHFHYSYKPDLHRPEQMEYTHSQMGSEEEESSHTEPLQQHFDGNFDLLSLKSVAATC